MERALAWGRTYHCSAAYWHVFSYLDTLRVMRQLAHSEGPSFGVLNRRFRKLEKNTKAEEAALESYTFDAGRRLSTLSWEDVLNSSRTVILGEPGSGKTWELRECAKTLSDRGEFSFFIRLDQ